MNLMSLVRTPTKKKAVAVGTAFATANPLLSAFLAGLGVMLWYEYRQRRMGTR